MQTPHGHGSVLAATRGGGGGADGGGGGSRDGRGGRRRRRCRRCCRRRRRRRRGHRDRASRGHHGQARERAGTSVRCGAAWRGCWGSVRLPLGRHGHRR